MAKCVNVGLLQSSDTHIVHQQALGKWRVFRGIAWPPAANCNVQNDVKLLVKGRTVCPWLITCGIDAVVAILAATGARAAAATCTSVSDVGFIVHCKGYGVLFPRYRPLMVPLHPVD